MRNRFLACAVLGLGFLAAPSRMPAQNEQFRALQSHFERVIGARFTSLFSGIENTEQWERRKQKTRNELTRMLWHDRRWPAHAPPATIVRREERPEYTIEILILETAPHLYLTANLFLPRTGQKPFPVILYQCGHASKNQYAHHGAWFAARGIAVLIMDNIEAGEIQSTHHGVYSQAWFHWYSRGYSPLAVELLNARRALDYLGTRVDIDSKRIGATGRSGGGMATFFLAALDERVKASAPVSGAFSTAGWIKQQLAFAHCDCQYPVNSYGLMYSEIGALTAPRKQLICNADADRGFPMNAFNEMTDKMREVYRLYNADGHLRTAVAPGGHVDSEAIRLPVYAFFLKEFLGVDTAVGSEGPVDKPPPDNLVCFRNGYPLDERLTRIDEELIPAYAYSPTSTHARETRIRTLTGQLRNEVFRYFPKMGASFDPAWSEETTSQRRTTRKVAFQSFEGLRVRGAYSLPDTAASGSRLPAVLVLDNRKGIPRWGHEQDLEGNRWGDRAVLVVETLDRGSRTLEENLRSFKDDDLLHHMKRQAMVAGATLESMQVYETLRSLEFLRSLPNVDPSRITIAGKGETGINGLYAALLDGNVHRVALGSPPASHRQGPSYLGILRYTDIPEVIALLRDKVRLYGELPSALQFFLANQGLDKTLFAGSLGDCLLK
jgi:cephalosporin-C deacetylase-like acetyl esterase